MKVPVVLAALVTLTVVFPRLAFSQSAERALEPSASSSAVGDYTAGPQDVLEVTVFGESDVSGKFLVEADGTFNFPMIGRVPAAGRTLRAIERELHNRLADGFLQNPQVTVAVGQSRSGRIFMVGEVLRPGTYPLTVQMTLIEALATAGSTTTAAAAHAVIIRGSQAGKASDVLQVDLGSFQTGSLADNIALRDGDVVVVPRAESIYILGEVRNPGAYTLEKATTVLQALALAGGVTPRASMSRIRIIRMVNAKKTELKANVDDVVRSGDTVMVLERFF